MNSKFARLQNMHQIYDLSPFHSVPTLTFSSFYSAAQRVPWGPSSD